MAPMKQNTQVWHLVVAVVTTLIPITSFVFFAGRQLQNMEDKDASMLAEIRGIKRSLDVATSMVAWNQRAVYVVYGNERVIAQKIGGSAELQPLPQEPDPTYRPDSSIPAGVGK